jgi:hypothetical protein
VRRNGAGDGAAAPSSTLRSTAETP